MKRFLLACFLLGVAFVGRSQIQINEFSPQPSSGDAEFVELRNTGAATNLQCYTIVTYVPAVTTGSPSSKHNAGFYTMTLPNFPVAAGAYVVLSSANSFSIQGQSGINADINWNALASGSMKFFEFNTATIPPTPTSYKVAAGTTITSVSDFFQIVSGGNGNESYGMYLFDNTGALVDAFQGGGGSNSTLSYIGYPSLPISGCSYSSLAWPSSYTTGQFGTSVGNSNSWGRIADCSSWDKFSTAPAPSPGLPNVPKANSGTSYNGTLTGTASYYCNTLNYTVTGPTTPYIIEVYNDNDGSKTLNGGDTYNRTINPASSPGTISGIASGTKLILVYRDAVGSCVGAMNAPVNATATLSATSVTSQCNSSIGFTFALSNTVSGVDYSFLYPITVSLYFGSNTNPTATKTINGPGTYTISGYNVPADVSSPTLFFTTSAGCTTYDNSFAVTPSSTNITVGGALGSIDANLNQRQAFYWLDNNNTGSGAYPLTVTMYEDANNDGRVDNGEVAIASHAYASNPGGITQYFGYLTDPNSDIVVIGTSNSGTNTCTATFYTAAQQAPLPVHFKSFNAMRKDDKVNLTWTTASEQNNRGFQVQRNIGNEWKNIAFVFSQAPNGTSTQELSYSYTDVNPSKGVSQYRILQVDLDGTGVYSQVRSVKGSAASEKLVLYPNPSNTGSVTLLFGTAGSNNVIVCDISGRTVQQYKAVTGSSLEIKNLTSGFYTVQVRDAATGATSTEKFIVTKR